MAWDTGITTDYLEGLGKQMFIKETILNGMFPCQSDFVKLLRNKKQDWSYHEFYEYRMLLANSNTGGSINSQLFTPSGALQKPGNIDMGIFRATYGVVSDGFDIDMIANIETSDAKKAFLTDYARQLHSMRMNVASIFRNVAINGRFGVVHRITDNDATIAGTPTAGTPFTLNVPSNVYCSGFMAGRLLIKTTTTVPDGPANTNEIYLILDNQPHWLKLVALNGSQPTEWVPGQFLELSDNRTTSNGATPGTLTPGTPYPTWTGSGTTYTTYNAATGALAGTGFMEGLADLLPWHVDGSFNRLGLDRPFRGQPNRQTYTTQQAGGFYMQGQNESIIDAIMGGVRLATLAVPYSELGVWMNHDTRLAIGAQEASDVRIFKQIAISQPIVFQRGVTATTYTVGSKEIPDTISDDNFPTDTVIIGPKSDLSYCTLDNSFMKIDEFVQNTFSKEAPPTPEKLTVPQELMTSLNIGKRFVVGSPVVVDGRTALGAFVHPGNRVPVLYHEMGSLFTENPYAYVIVKLRKQIVNPAEAANW
jgi:hypothetical protein